MLNFITGLGQADAAPLSAARSTPQKSDQAFEDAFAEAGDEAAQSGVGDTDLIAGQADASPSEEAATESGDAPTTDTAITEEPDGQETGDLSLPPAMASNSAPASSFAEMTDDPAQLAAAGPVTVRSQIAAPPALPAESRMPADPGRSNVPTFGAQPPPRSAEPLPVMHGAPTPGTPPTLIEQRPSERGHAPLQTANPQPPAAIHVANSPTDAAQSDRKPTNPAAWPTQTKSPGAPPPALPEAQVATRITGSVPNAAASSLATPTGHIAPKTDIPEAAGSGSARDIQNATGERPQRPILGATAAPPAASSIATPVRSEVGPGLAVPAPQPATDVGRAGRAGGNFAQPNLAPTEQPREAPTLHLSTPSRDTTMIGPKEHDRTGSSPQVATPRDLATREPMANRLTAQSVHLPDLARPVQEAVRDRPGTPENLRLPEHAAVLARPATQHAPGAPSWNAVAPQTAVSANQTQIAMPAEAESPQEDVGELRFGMAAHGQAQGATSSATSWHAMRADTPASVIRQMAEQAAQLRQGAVDLRLNPEELGRVQMKISTTDTGITLSITAERGETLDLLRRNINELGREFASMGFSEIDFAFGDSNDSGSRTSDPDTWEEPLGDPSEKPADVALARPALQPSSSPGGIAAAGLDIRL